MSGTTRQHAIGLIREHIADHCERSEDLHRFGDHWWRISKCAWWCAANVHRQAARELHAVLRQIEAGIFDPDSPQDRS